MPLVAGVDSSTQSCKVVIRDAATGRSCAPAAPRTPTAPRWIPPHGGARCLSASPDAGGLDGVEAISVGGQQHGMVVLDAEGRVIRDGPALERHPFGAGGARPDRRGRRRRVRPTHRRGAGRLLHRDEAPVAAGRRARERGARRRRGAPPRLAHLGASAATGRSASRRSAPCSRSSRPIAPTRAARRTGAPTATTAICSRGRSGTTRSSRACSARARRPAARPTASSSARVRATTRRPRSASTRHPATSSCRSARAARSSP
jgi:hypothetical protein